METTQQKEKLLTKNCKECQKPIRSWRKFCSPDCWYEFLRHNRKSCLRCGNRVKMNTHNYCSNSCAQITRYKDITNHPSWEGGKSKSYKKLRNGLWRELGVWRDAVLKRDDYKCVQCGDTKSLEADHIKPFILYPELRFVIENGRTLCKLCHIKTETYGTKIKTYKKSQAIDYLFNLITK